MLQNLLPLLPQRIGNAGLAGIAGSLVLGGGLWLAGARFGRPLLALAATLGGGAIGFQSPQWFGWKLDPWSTAMLGALLLGIVAFFAHRYVQAVALGSLLAAWAALAIVAAFGLDDHWKWPAFSSRDSIWDYATALQQSLPTHVAIVLLYAAGLAGVFGVAFGVLSHQISSVVFWSMLGISLILFCALTAIQSAQPQYLRMIPSQPAGQSFILVALVALGAAIQWKIAFAKPRPKGPAPVQSPATTG